MNFGSTLFLNTIKPLERGSVPVRFRLMPTHPNVITRRAPRYIPTNMAPHVRNDMCRSVCTFGETLTFQTPVGYCHVHATRMKVRGVTRFERSRQSHEMGVTSSTDRVTRDSNQSRGNERTTLARSKENTPSMLGQRSEGCIGTTLLLPDTDPDWQDNCRKIRLI